MNLNGSEVHEFSIFFDGGGTAERLAVAAVVVNTAGELVLESAREVGKGTNNVAEYKGLLHAISLAHFVGAERPHFVSDSMLVVQQISMYWAIKEPELAKLHGIASSRLMEFPEWSIQHVGRNFNKRADWLVSKLLGNSRTLKHAPTTGIQFRTGEPRKGWAGAVTE